MKRFAYTLSVLSILLVAGCKETKKDKEKTADSKTEKTTEAATEECSILTVDTLTFEAHTPLYEGSSNGFDISIDIEWPKTAENEEVLENLQKGISGFLFGSRLATTDIEFAMKAYASKSAELYLEENSMEDELDDEFGYVTSWSEYCEGKFLEPYKEFISYQDYTYGYSGGAHGMDALNCITFNIKTGEKIEAEELFRENYEDRLVASLRANLLCCVEDIDMLFEKDIYPSEEFYITPQGITYIYQRYEIAPYALGIIEVTIPWKEIKDILKEEKTSGRASQKTDRMNHNPIINN